MNFDSCFAELAVYMRFAEVLLLILRKLDLHPLLETELMDKFKWALAFAGGDEGTVVCFCGAEADPALFGGLLHYPNVLNFDG